MAGRDADGGGEEDEDGRGEAAQVDEHAHQQRPEPGDGVADADGEPAAPHCHGAFVDTSRNGRRRYCEPTVCGNRINVASYCVLRRPTTPNPRSPG